MNIQQQQKNYMQQSNDMRYMPNNIPIQIIEDSDW